MESKHLSPSQQTSDWARQAREWIASESGQRTVRDVVAHAEKAHAELQKVRKVDPESLNQPVTF